MCAFLVWSFPKKAPAGQAGSLQLMNILYVKALALFDEPACVLVRARVVPEYVNTFKMDLCQTLLREKIVWERRACSLDLEGVAGTGPVDLFKMSVLQFWLLHRTCLAC